MQRSEIREATSSLLLVGWQPTDRPIIAETHQDGIAVVVGTFLARVGGKRPRRDMIIVDPALKAPLARLAIPVIASFQCPFRIDQTIRDILDVANFPFAATDFQQ
jgi:hypothetical protein